MKGSARPAPRHLLLGAVGGVVVAHLADYLVVFPDGADRAEHLRASGHGYWSLALAAAGLAGLAALAWASVLGARRARPCTARPPSAGIAGAIALVGAWQVVVFTTLEVLERVLSGAPVAPFATSPELVVGVALQVVVAAAVVVVLALVETATARVVAALGRPTAAHDRRDLRPSATLGVVVVFVASPCRPRGPPRLSPSF